MSDQHGWRYYRYGIPGVDAHLLYYRRWRGITHLLRRGVEPLSWVPSDDNRLSRYIENGETSLDEVTRETIKSEIGQPLPA